MRLLFCGVRGSTTVSGADYLGYGGHTSCLALSVGAERPSLVLDAGTGLMRLAQTFGGAPFLGTILLTHLHWDHVQGLPFFGPGDHDDAEVELLLPLQKNGATAEAVLAGAMSPPHFPIGPTGLRGQWRFESIDEGHHEVESFSVVAREIPHKGGRTFGYRISDGMVTIAYLPDHGPLALGPGRDGFGTRTSAALELADGVDVLVHGAPFLMSESERAREYGHATVEFASVLAAEAGARRLVLTHHGPYRTDTALDAIAATLADAPVPTVLAREGFELLLTHGQR